MLNLSLFFMHASLTKYGIKVTLGSMKNLQKTPSMIHKVIIHHSNIKMYHILYVEKKTCKKDPLHLYEKNIIFFLLFSVKSQFFCYTQMCVYMWILPLSGRTCMCHESLSFYHTIFYIFWGSSIHAYVSK